jgi:ABC-type Fe3+ transport system permease subunit
MCFVDWVLLVVGFGGLFLCFRSFPGADLINITLLIPALALAVLALAIGFKAVLDAMKSKNQTIP